MTVLITSEQLDHRTAAVNDSFAALAFSLASDLETVLSRPLFVPETKAALTREGGRCPSDGAMLDFDPFSPRDHRCPRCARVYTGELHDLFWNYWYQLWLAERAVHAAVLGRLGVVRQGLQFAGTILDRYSDLYQAYPNVDNALGPTRPFFSTYLESIWLLQLCTALDVMETSPGWEMSGARFRDRVVAPSRALIASFDEGSSNRQVWNNAAMMAASLVLGRADEAESIVWARSGLASHLGEAMLPDGTWYEGENYHLFAHRGLWYAMQMAATNGFEVPDELAARYDRGFVTPLLTSLPDLTFPSRRDSQYAISLRQWRFAEMCELGLARGENRTLSGMLDRLYADDVPRAETGRWKSSAEAERNLPPSALTRADLGWKSLLFANEGAVLSGGGALGSVLLESQGIGVLRRDRDSAYVALDYGNSGGGHGHPDRLNLLLMDGDRRILDDVGTGSYVDPSLHWYRSTLAHNAPMFDGRSQVRVDGALTAYEDRGAAGWIAATAMIAPGGVARRAVIAMPDYVVDEVEWTAESGRTFDLPLHVDVAPVGGSAPVSQILEGSAQLEDGFRFLRDPTLVATIPANEVMALSGPGLDVWLGGDGPLQLWRAVAPGPPGRDDAPMLLARGVGASGVIRTVWSWKTAVRSATLFPKFVVDTNEARHDHARADHGWNIVIQVGEARSSIDLEGLVDQAPWAASSDAPVQGTTASDQVLKPGEPVEVLLGEESYSRSEQSWAEAGSPTALVTLLNADGVLELRVSVRADRTFVRPATVNRLDNEPADINGAGLQLYLRTTAAKAGYVIVPIEGTSSLSVRPIDGWGADVQVAGTWQQAEFGYDVDLRIFPEDPSLSLDLIVNEKPAGRERRRGQLTLSGGGDFIYLRGDRHDAARLIPFLIAPE